METLIDQIKKQASGFLQEKCRTARLAFTDVSEAEMLAEEATNNDPWGPDAKTMTKLADASCDADDYWRIVDVLHRRLYTIDWKQWRQSYKTLILLEFLLTHGAEDFAIEFQCDSAIIQELTTFTYIDGKGFNWGTNMQIRAENILKLLAGGPILREARSKAIKLTNEIQGVGGSMSSSAAASPSSPSSSETSRSSFGSYTTNSSAWNDFNDQLKTLEQSPSSSPVSGLLTPRAAAATRYSLGGIQEDRPVIMTEDMDNKDNNFLGFHVWESPPAEESGSLLLYPEDDVNDQESSSVGFLKGFCSKLATISPTKMNSNGDKKAYRSLSDNNRNAKKKLHGRRYSSRF